MLKDKKLVKAVLLFLVMGTLFVFSQSLEKETKTETVVKMPEKDKEKTKAIMMLIEYKDTEGLVNFVNDLDSRGIYSLLSVSPDFVEENCETIKKLLDHKMELVAQNPTGSFWDMPYQEQLETVIASKQKIEACTGQPLRAISSQYFASDENTVKVAEKLEIPYVLARGVKGTEAIVFQPEEYLSVKILSVSNIPTIEFEYGSLCDYSYWVRQGSPEDMLKELRAGLNNKKITPVSHTNIGGYKARWNQMWLKFFDTAKIDWLPLDEYATVDKLMPMWQIPKNKNTPYTPEIRPEIPYNEEENLQNPCSVGQLSSKVDTEVSETTNEQELIMFHNGKGSMCLEAMAFLESTNYPSKQILNSEINFQKQLQEAKINFDKSEGVTDDFGYYPIIFIKDRVFSGFDENIKAEILKEIGLSNY